MLQLQTLRQFSDGRLSAVGKALDGQEQLMLLRFIPAARTCSSLKPRNRRIW
jgi:hypothetical protein